MSKSKNGSGNKPRFCSYIYGDNNRPKEGPRILKRVICIAVSVILTLLSVSALAYAAEDVRMQDVENIPITLTVCFHIDGDGGDKIPVDGAKFGICKVADLTVNGGSADYSTVDLFASDAIFSTDGRETTFNGIEIEESQKLAKSFSAVAEENGLLLVKDAANGECTFTVNEPGIYLVVETAKSGEAEKYATADPFLVMLPAPQRNNDGFEWNYAVTAEPKTAPERFPEPETESEIESEIESESETEPVNPPSPVTGNDINIAAWISLAVSVLCITVIAIISKREEKHGE